MYKRQNGFTLIELLIVIAIIGVLSAIVLFAVNDARRKSRDVNRIQEIKQIQTALELYYDKHGSYPLSGGTPDYPNYTWINECDQSTFLIPELVSEGFITHISDPMRCADHWGYMYGSNGTDYKFISHGDSSIRSLPGLMDPAEDGGTDNCILDGPGADPSLPPADENRHFGVWTSGALCWVEQAPIP